jgi:hypothetical protein
MASAELSRRVEKVVGYPPLLDMGADYARMLHVREGPRDRDRSRELLETVITGFTASSEWRPRQREPKPSRDRRGAPVGVAGIPYGRLLVRPRSV